MNAKFHTYQLKQERPFRVVLRNIHHSVDLDELKFELQTLGHEVTNIGNIRHRVTKNPLSLFFVDLKRKANNKEIYNVNRLMNSIVKFEPPLVKKEIVQCKRCQRYGHTQKYCNHYFPCVKCAGNHPNDQCTKSPETPAKCTVKESILRTTKDAQPIKRYIISSIQNREPRRFPYVNQDPKNSPHHQYPMRRQHKET